MVMLAMVSVVRDLSGGGTWDNLYNGLNAPWTSS